MSSAPTSPAEPPDLLPECPELQVPFGTVNLAEENLYHMLELLASSDNLSFDLHLNYIERIAAVQDKLLAMRKAIHQLDCAAADRQSAAPSATTPRPLWFLPPPIARRGCVPFLNRIGHSDYNIN